MDPIPEPGLDEVRARPSLRAGFGSLRHPSYRLLLTATVASNMAMGMQMLANSYLAYQLTGSYALVGVISLSMGLPMMLFSLIGGATADRMDKRRLLLITQVLTGVFALLTGLLIAAGLMTVSLLFMIGLLQGTVMTFRMPTQMSLMPQLVPRAELASAVGLSNAAATATRPLAPTVAGLLLASYGVESVYFANALMYALTLTVVSRLPSGLVAHQGAGARPGMRGQIAEAFRYILGDRALLLLMVMGLVPLLSMMPLSQLMPGFVQDELGLPPQDLGVLLGIAGLGALVGSLGVASMASSGHRAGLQVTSGLLIGAALIAVGVGARAFGFAGAFVALFALGLFQTVYMTVNITALMTAMRPEFLGRVMSIHMMSFSVMPLMALPIGFVADRITAAGTFGALGAIVLCGMAALSLRGRALLDASPAVRRPAPPAALPAASRD